MLLLSTKTPLPGGKMCTYDMNLTLFVKQKILSPSYGIVYNADIVILLQNKYCHNAYMKYILYHLVFLQRMKKHESTKKKFIIQLCATSDVFIKYQKWQAYKRCFQIPHFEMKIDLIINLDLETLPLQLTDNMIQLITYIYFPQVQLATTFNNVRAIVINKSLCSIISLAWHLN